MNDNLNLTGLVSIINKKTGEIILDKKHNLVVNSGRAIIANSLVDTSNSKKLAGVFASDDTSETIITFSSIPNSAKKIEFDNETNTITSETVAEHPYIEAKISVSSDIGLNLVSSLGLYFTDNTPFSRIVFDPILLDTGTEYSIIYDVYI